MRSYFIPVLAALLMLIGCSGEGYVQVNNNTPASILVSVNNSPDETVAPGDTTDTYTVRLVKGVVNNISVDASGEWVGNYSGTVAVTDGEHVVHRVHSRVADISVVNTSVDSAVCYIENADPLYFTGNDSISDKFNVDANVDVEYAGRYMFSTTSVENWFPGSAYRFPLIPNACEIQLNNVHSNRAIYYVYISPSDATEWGNDQLGDDVILYTQEAYVWKAEGDIQWDMRVEAGDPHPDSALYAYEYYDTEGCPSDYTWIYEFPAIFTEITAATSSKMSGPASDLMKPAGFEKRTGHRTEPARIEKIRKADAGKAGLKALKK